MHLTGAHNQEPRCTCWALRLERWAVNHEDRGLRPPTAISEDWVPVHLLLFRNLEFVHSTLPNVCARVCVCACVRQEVGHKIWLAPKIGGIGGRCSQNLWEG